MYIFHGALYQHVDALKCKSAEKPTRFAKSKTVSVLSLPRALKWRDGTNCRMWQLNQKQFRNGSTRKEFSAVVCTDENFFPAKGAEEKKRNWNGGDYEKEIGSNCFDRRHGGIHAGWLWF
ncbi:MAG: hypothetical protein NC420_15785 [Eubacterium sp.]|nr:hypothetical protein [Eubacterium sp.]